MYKCKQNFSYAESKFFKGEVYDDFPSKYAWAFEEIKEKKEEKHVGVEKVETASKKPKAKKR
ncbi:MAG: hypothetical protein ACRBG0_19125 [Lewinella sp.]|uniref:hypothetical protein n=1 Tax=Lewinella sp. TaxID=2004506 RepID=UPI003D6B8192